MFVIANPHSSQQSTPLMLTEIYYELDEFHKYFYTRFDSITSGSCKQPRPCKGLTVPEISSILIHYHQCYYKNFKRYYQEYVCKDLRNDFPKLPSYKNFVGLIPSVFNFLRIYVSYCCKKAKRTGKYYIDSTPIKACHIKRAPSNKVMKGIASHGKTSVGWFFGIKIHLIINELGEIMNVMFTEGSKADNNVELMESITSGLKGLLYGDKGYIMKAKNKTKVERDGELKLITKKRKNMKPDQKITREQQKDLKQRGVIECVIANLKEEGNVEHTRHRSAKNAMVSMLAAIAAYSFYQRKPSVKLNNDPTFLELPSSAFERA
jgi:hypothetical protein